MRDWELHLGILITQFVSKTRSVTRMGRESAHMDLMEYSLIELGILYIT